MRRKNIVLAIVIITPVLICNLNIGWADEVDDLIQQLQNKDVSVRQSAAYALR
jgi:hypothetical protein